jgi:hypothetical protein
MSTKTTVGQLVASLYAEFVARHHHTRGAALATHDAIVNLTRGRAPEVTAPVGRAPHTRRARAHA